MEVECTEVIHLRCIFLLGLGIILPIKLVVAL